MKHDLRHRGTPWDRERLSWLQIDTSLVLLLSEVNRRSMAVGCGRLPRCIPAIEPRVAVPAQEWHCNAANAHQGCRRLVDRLPVGYPAKSSPTDKSILGTSMSLLPCTSCTLTILRLVRFTLTRCRCQTLQAAALHELDIQRASPSAQSQRAAWTLACFRSFTLRTGQHSMQEA